jgi:hypothetical protein
MPAYKIIIGATQNRETGEITPIYREATEEQFIAWMRPILHAAGALRDAGKNDAQGQASLCR